MSALPLNMDVTFSALTTDFSRFGRPLFCDPDWLAAIRAPLLFRRHSWRRHLGDPITDDTQSAVDDIIQSTALRPDFMLVDGASCSSYRNKALCYARNGSVTGRYCLNRSRWRTTWLRPLTRHDAFLRLYDNATSVPSDVVVPQLRVWSPSISWQLIPASRMRRTKSTAVRHRASSCSCGD